MILIENKTVRRRDKRVWYLLGMIFVAVFVFSFLVQRDKVLDEEVGAANLGKFDPGYIISDYQMSNYNSMNEAEIQAFLKSKNSCNDTNLGRYTAGEKVSYFSEMSPPRTWHIKDGHFVCMADETFEGGTAAHIIYKAAQDYRINPQVLLVLLEKEQSLVRDTFPHSQQYRSATGYGCPDTAACSSKYYGLNNQIRNAAALFRTVLDGGWTNYPLGENYVQYNPSAACGGSVVNIRNLATSALYRYTPYQPNAVTLAGGNNSCSAYGNLNFYRYFEDWFGGITKVSSYVKLDSPRYLELKNDTERINPYTEEVVDVLPAGTVRKYDSKIRLPSGEWCLRTEYSTANNSDSCVRFSELTEIKLEYEMIPKEEQEKIITKDAKKTLIRADEEAMDFSDYIIRNFVKKTSFNGVNYYITEFDSQHNNSEYGIPEKYLLDSYAPFEKPKQYILTQDTERINPFTGEVYDILKKGQIINFMAEIEVDGIIYYQTKNNNDNKINAAVDVSRLAVADDSLYEPFMTPRKMVLLVDVDRINPFTGEVYDRLGKGRIIMFSTKIFINNNWYYRTENNTINHINAVIPSWAVGEVL